MIGVWWRMLAAACWLCLLALAPAHAKEPDVQQMTLQRTGEGLYLSARLALEPTPAVEDALLKGVPLYFVWQADVYRDRWYWTDLRVASAARTLRLAYLPLTGRWRVNIVSGLITSSSGLRATLSQNYETLPEALSAIQRVAHWKIADASEVQPGEPYTLNLNFWLDLSQLPRPFQIGVAGQRDWTISAQVRDRLRLMPVPSPAEGGK